MHCMVINYTFIENRSREKKACIWYIHLNSSALTFHGAFSPRVSCCILYQLYVNVQLLILFFLHFVHQYNVYFFHMFQNTFHSLNLDTSIQNIIGYTIEFESKSRIWLFKKRVIIPFEKKYNDQLNCILFLNVHKIVQEYRGIYDMHNVCKKITIA